MKSIIYILSLSLVLAPVQTYAIAPVAIAGSVAGRVAVQTASGAVVKKLTGGAISGLAHGAVALCITGQLSSLSFCRKIKQAMANDGVNYGGSGSGASGSWEVEIYRQNTGEGCNLEVAFRSGDSYFYDVTSYYDHKLSELKRLMSQSSWGKDRDFRKKESFAQRLKESYESAKKSLASQQKQQGESFYTNNWVQFNSSSMYYEYIPKNPASWHTWQNYEHGYASIYYKCPKNSGDRNYLTNQEINNYFNKSINDNDITNIYNYDYAQHNNITINNNTLSGDTINNYKTEVENETQNITNNVVNQIVNNQIDIDDINDRNCTKDTEGRYNNCGANNNDNPPNNNDSNNDDDNSNSGGSNSSDENKTCNSNPFFRKICDWLDWTQQKHQPNTDTTVNIKTGELPSIRTDKVQFSNQCPPPKQISIEVLGQTYTEQMSYQPLCDFFSSLKPFIIGLGYLSGAFIIAGRRS